MKQKKLNIIISAILCSLVVPALSQEDTLSAVTVTGELSNSIDVTLENTDTINVDDLSNPAVTDMATALDNQTSVTFNFDGNGNAIYPVIRGMGKNYNEITIDGDKAPNYYTYGHGMYNSGQRNFIETDTLKKIEVIKGRHSPKQGSGALSGSVNMRTYEPSDFVSKDDPYYFSVKSGYSNRNDNFGNTLMGAGAVGDFSGMVIYSHRESKEVDNLGSDESGTKHSKIENSQDNVLLKGELDLGLGRVIVTGEHFDADKTTTKRHSEKPSTEEPTKRNRFSIKGEFEDALGLDALEAKISYQDFANTSQYYSTHGPIHQMKLGEFNQERYSISVDGEKHLSLGGIDNNLLFGAGYERSEFDFKRVDVKTKNQYRPLPLTKRDIAHVYLKNNIIFKNGLTLSPGVRIERKKLATESDKFYDNNGASAIRAVSDDSATVVTPSFGATWSANENLTIHAGYSEGEKTADDNYFSSVDHGRFYIVPNPDLKDEKSKNIEVGFNYAVNDNVDFGINVFQTKYDDFISYESSALPNGVGIMIPDNIGSVETSGVEITSNIAFNESLEAHLGVSWMDGTEQDGGEESLPLLTANPASAIIGVNYHNNDTWGASVNVKLAGKGAAPDNPVRFQTPGYGVTNLTGWWKPLKGLKVSGGAYNVFDKKYWTSDNNGTYTTSYYGPVDMDKYSQPGRNFGINLKYEY